MGNIGKTIKNFGVKEWVTGLMVLAMITSWGNIHSYFAAGHTNMITTVVGATLLGAGLVIVSHGVLIMRPRFSFWYMFVCALAVAAAIVSGMIQTEGYKAHYDGWQPYIMGYGIPFLFEVGLAFMGQAIEQEMKRHRMADMQSALGDGTHAALAEAVRDIDPTMIKQMVQKDVSRFARAFVSSTLEDMYAELQDNRKIAPQIAPAELSYDPVATLETAPNAPQHDVLRSGLDVVNAEKKGKVAQRQAQLLEIAAQGGAALADVMERLRVSENTIRNDVKALAQHGVAINDGVLSLG